MCMIQARFIIQRPCATVYGFAKGMDTMETWLPGTDESVIRGWGVGLMLVHGASVWVLLTRVLNANTHRRRHRVVVVLLYLPAMDWIRRVSPACSVLFHDVLRRPSLSLVGKCILQRTGFFSFFLLQLNTFLSCRPIAETLYANTFVSSRLVRMLTLFAVFVKILHCLRFK